MKRCHRTATSGSHRLPALALALLGCLAPGCAAGAAGDPPVPAEPFAIYDPAADRYLSMDELAAAVSAADVVLFGEQHDDAPTHVAERRLLEALAARGTRVVVGLEMFERDVQPAMDAYLAGRSSEAEFLEAARGWPNYLTSYRPLVELGRARGWPVVASNVPRSLAAAVALGGLDALARLDPFHRSFAAADVQCPKDEYYRRFVDVMGAHPGHTAPGAGASSAMERIYEAQCLKDETMAESIVRSREPGSVVVHFNGGFHSDYHLGIPPRVLRRDPGLRVVVLSAIPVSGAGVDERERLREIADYVLLTRRAEAR